MSLSRALPFSLSLYRLSPPPPPCRTALPELIPGLFGREGRRCRPRIIAVEYIDPERHIDRRGREWNNNLHCYCEPIRRNQTGPALSRGPLVPTPSLRHCPASPRARPVSLSSLGSSLLLSRLFLFITSSRRSLPTVSSSVSFSSFHPFF